MLAETLYDDAGWWKKTERSSDEDLVGPCQGGCEEFAQDKRTHKPEVHERTGQFILATEQVCMSCLASCTTVVL